MQIDCYFFPKKISLFIICCLHLKKHHAGLEPAPSAWKAEMLTNYTNGA